MTNVPWDEPSTTLLLNALHDKKTYGEALIDLQQHGYTMSRSACIAKARRMGVSNGRPVGLKKPKEKKAAASPRQRSTVVKPKIAAHKMPKPRPEPEPAPVVATRERSGLLIDLDHDQCRFPLGPINSRPPYLFCTNDRRERSSYCAHHHRIVYVPANKNWA